ncbi:MAG: general secretion pathway protein GspK [Thiohalocapsa sp.]
MSLGAGRERGIAIVAALWASAIVAVIVMSVLQLVRADARVGVGREERVTLNAIADAAINLTILGMLEPDAAKWPVNSKPITVPFDGHEVLVRIEDEAGKIDLNTTGLATLRDLLTVAGLESDAARQLADAILAWHQGRRGEGDAPSATAASYANRSYGPRNAAFQSVEELQLVSGMTPELYRRLRPLVTVYSQTPWIDPAFASAGVLAVFRTTNANADAALRRREAESRGAAEPPARGVTLGHAFTITAELTGPAAARVVRTAIIRLTGNPQAPLLIYKWG